MTHLKGRLDWNNSSKAKVFLVTFFYGLYMLVYLFFFIFFCKYARKERKKDKCYFHKLLMFVLNG